MTNPNLDDVKDEWLIVKRDLYFLPDCKGYTGIRDEAGRYSYDFAHGYEGNGCSAVHISEAPEFRAAAFHDLVIKHLIKQRDDALRLASQREDVIDREAIGKLVDSIRNHDYGNYGLSRDDAIDAILPLVTRAGIIEECAKVVEHYDVVSIDDDPHGQFQMADAIRSLATQPRSNRVEVGAGRDSIQIGSSTPNDDLPLSPTSKGI